MQNAGSDKAQAGIKVFRININNLRYADDTTLMAEREEKVKSLFVKVKSLSYFCFIDYAKAFDCVDQNKPLKILKEMGITDHLTCLLRNMYPGQEATVRTGHGTQTGSKLGKEYVNVVCCYPAYLTSMQSTSCKMLG